MATSKAKGKSAGSTARKTPSTGSAATASKRARTTTAKSAQTAINRKSAARRPAPQVTTGETSAYGHAFWSRAGILWALALGILILVQVNADRPAETTRSQHRSAGAPAHTGNYNKAYAYPPAGYSWHPAPAYYPPATPAPGYGYRPHYGPWSPGGAMQAPGYRNDRKG